MLELLLLFGRLGPKQNWLERRLDHVGYWRVVCRRNGTTDGGNDQVAQTNRLLQTSLVKDQPDAFPDITAFALLIVGRFAIVERRLRLGDAIYHLGAS